jgi:hypothetical protein
LIRSLRAADVQRSAEQTFANQLEVFRPKVSVRFAVELLQLTQLLCEGHAAEQRVNPCFDLLLIGSLGADS